jgi:hypothetical protein
MKSGIITLQETSIQQHVFHNSHEVTGEIKALLQEIHGELQSVKWRPT